MVNMGVKLAAGTNTNNRIVESKMSTESEFVYF